MPAPATRDVMGHAGNCVCSWCLATRPLPTLGDAYREARARSSLALTLQQASLLHKFTHKWNDDRARRGEQPYHADEALTKGLEALIAMLTEGAQA